MSESVNDDVLDQPKKPITTRIDPDLYREAKIYCAANDVPFQSLIDDALREKLGLSEPVSQEEMKKIFDN